MKNKNNFGRWTVAAVAVLMMCIGIYYGEVQTVLSKAINICLECIGIG
jgi:hypothetical protein